MIPPDFEKRAAELSARVARDAPFIVNFATATVKMRRATDAKEGVSLTADETRAILDGLNVLRSGPR